jgi:5-(carboxyamino)imidazole ribonucleotide mutase
VRILAASDEALRAKMIAYQDDLKQLVAAKNTALQAQISEI